MKTKGSVNKIGIGGEAGIEIIEEITRFMLLYFYRNKQQNSWRIVAEVSLKMCAISNRRTIEKISNFILEIFTAVTMKSTVFLDVAPCSFCENRRFGGK
jgi:hypothetical protein